MAKAVRAKSDKPDTVYFDDWFVKVPLSELIGKVVYVEPNCYHMFSWDKEFLKKIKAMGVNVVSKKEFNPKTCDYIIVYTNWTKKQEKDLTKEDKLAWKCWEECGHPQRLSWDHLQREDRDSQK